MSTLMNRQTVENYLFRNYTYPEGVTSHYPGSYHHRVWEAIRASSAAPTYYQEFKLGDFIHQVSGRGRVGREATAPGGANRGECRYRLATGVGVSMGGGGLEWCRMSEYLHDTRVTVWFHQIDPPDRRLS